MFGVDFDNDNWIDNGDFYTLYVNQLTTPWFNIRNKLLTCSNFAAAIGESPFCTPKQLARYYLYNESYNTPNQESIIKMAKGIELEPLVVELYSTKYNVEVEEMSLSVPIWNNEIGGSPDGLVGENGAGKSTIVKMNDGSYNPDKGKIILNVDY